MMAELRVRLADIGLADPTWQKLTAFLELFEKWNQRINLSAASTRRELIEHLEDSLHIVPVLRGQQRVLDVGSGGGFPVIAAAISLAEVTFVALEPIHKKHAFLRTAARELGLPNLEARVERIEDHEHYDYDVVTSRATFDLKEWLELGSARVKPGGFVIGFEAIPRSDLPGTIERVPYELGAKQRALVIARR